jgi:glycosyltransferase involved in cell wall biosynthesis
MSLFARKIALTQPQECLALAWFYHRRFESLTPPLGIPRYVLSSKARKPIRELILSWRTFLLLCARRPKVVLVQNPSLICTLFVAMLQPVFGYQIVVDAHGDAVIPYAHNWRVVRAVTFYLLKLAQLTIVTNTGLARRVTAHGGRPFVLFDNLPHVPNVPVRDLGPGKHVMFISTYAADEPHREVFQAADALKARGVVVHVTGKPRAERLAELPAKPQNVRLTGFLAEQEYWTLLKSCDVVVDLTTMPDCLVCGAYEAIAAGRALVLSDNPPSRELFGAAALYTENTTMAITASIERALDEQTLLEGAAREQACAMQARWNEKALALSGLFAHRFQSAALR